MAAARLTRRHAGGRGDRNVVLKSIETPARDRCVDIFRRPDGSFGFEEFRRDPEDPSGWRRIGFFGGHVFANAQEATAQAHAHVAWLAGIAETP